VSGILQRQCACGTHTIAGGECASCGKEKATGHLQRAATSTESVEEVTPVVHEILRSSGQPLDAHTRSFLEPRFNHDFSHIAVRENKTENIQSKLSVSQPRDAHEREAEQIADSVTRISESELGPFSSSNNLFSGVQIHAGVRAAQSAHLLNARAFTVGNHIVFGNGQYQPHTNDGRRLIVHELAHTLQQSSAGGEHGNAGTVVHRAPQEPTLDEARKSGKSLPVKKLKEMDVSTLVGMPSGDRNAWYVEKLGSYENQLKESANRHVVPVQLLATVILNELADINWTDTVQSDLFVSKGSLGIAQIQIDTAIKDNLFPDLTEAEGKLAYNEMVANVPSPSGKGAARIMQNKDREQRLAINKRLQVPQHAIDAAGREIRILLNQMIASRGSSWQTRFGFTHTTIPSPLSAQAIYTDVGGSSQREKEVNLANLITGAYNSPNIIRAADSSQNVFPNANIHGQNSRLIAGDLFDFKLFRP